MKITDDIVIEGNLIKNSTIKVQYTGKFAKEFPKEVLIMYGYGLGWKNIQEKKMTWTGDSFFAEIDLVESGELYFCFKNASGAWDNNSGNDFSVLIASNGENEPNKENISNDNKKQAIDMKDRYKRIHVPEKETAPKTGRLRDNEESLYEYVNNSEKYEDRFSNVNDIINSDKFSKKSSSSRINSTNRTSSTRLTDKKNAKKPKKKKSKAKKILRLLFLLILGFCIIYYAVNYYKIKNLENDNQKLLDTSIDKSQLDENKEGSEMLLKVKELNSEYPDLKAWIEIEDTAINYPVMQGTDNNYYIKHDYKKEYSKWGALFLDKDYDWEKPSSNLLIYGHNFSDGIMFADLLKYRDKEFYNNHKTIKFTTTEEYAEYEVLSVFNSRVYYKSETNVFRYYFFVDAETEEEYDEYVKNAKKASLYENDVEAKYGDQLLTLSTCDYTQEDGRFVVVARKIDKQANQE